MTGRCGYPLSLACGQQPCAELPYRKNFGASAPAGGTVATPTVKPVKAQLSNHTVELELVVMRCCAGDGGFRVKNLPGDEVANSPKTKSEVRYEVQLPMHSDLSARASARGT